MYDSAESFPQPKCHPKTRAEMLKDLRGWVLDPEPKTSILWLYGPAGAGKSAIMQTLAGQLRDLGRLGGCFFFKRGHATRGNARTLFATIAYQLALSVSCLRTPIFGSVENDPSIVARSIDTQMRKLISEPCSPHTNHDPLAIIIDGLDECDGHDVQQEILRVIRHTSSDNTVPFRFFVAPKPIFAKCSTLHSIPYLCDEFARIHREHYTMAKIPLPWPTPIVLERLVENSSGHFIYAFTIIKFIDDKNYRPTQRLAVVQDPNLSPSGSAFNTLDQLYVTILSSAPRQSQIIPILCAIVCLRVETGQIEHLFALEEGETRLLLRGLHSVLHVPREDKDPISSHHASFLDFLKYPDRSGNFCVSTLTRKIGLARSLLQFCAGPFQFPNTRLLSCLVPFIVLLPPSGAIAELFPLIESINPDYIFDPKERESGYDYIKVILSWFKNAWSAECPSVEHIVSPSPELLRIVVSMGLLRYHLWELPTKLDMTWTDLTPALCSLRPKFVGDEHALPIHQPQAVYPWAARDVALRLIRKLVKNHIETDGGVNPSACRDAVFRTSIRGLGIKDAYTYIQQDLGSDISYLVRLSSPCPELYRELWSIPPSDLWSSWPSGNKLIHNVSKWLESFPDSTMELITFWQQAVPDHDRHRISRFNPSPNFWEREWCGRVPHYNEMVLELHLPGGLQFPV
ncbi:hypothetical protein C8R45DRAFT_1099374 [Mycena sanguinolenta]|nr:hypothetical protein C8R45DRAFT_1099374 [Mycena sanguinolenta]